MWELRNARYISIVSHATKLKRTQSTRHEITKEGRSRSFSCWSVPKGQKTLLRRPLNTPSRLSDKDTSPLVLVYYWPFILLGAN